MAIISKPCRECGQKFTAKRDRADAVFCGSACRSTFNNRRFVRGAQLYDVFMLLRYERGLAVAAGLWKLICRMAQDWREDDMRQGRQSWRPYSELRDALLPYRADAMGGGVSRGRAQFENNLSAAARARQ